MRTINEPGSSNLRTAVLLGAGASRDAGLPLTEHLARQLVESFEDELATIDGLRADGQSKVVQALRLVYGAIVAHGTDQGESPLSAVNVERLISAVRLLRDRRTHEAAPFVAAWRPSIDQVDDHPLPIEDSELQKDFGFDRDLQLQVRGLGAHMAAIAEAARMPGNGEVFRDLEDQILRRICELLSSPGSVDYLKPLIELAQKQIGGLDVITLNYDKTVELAAERFGARLDLGLDRWEPGSPLVFESSDGTVNLIKPHGSIDWVRITSSGQKPLSGHPLRQHEYRAATKPSPGRDRGTTDKPLIVIGDREKLDTDGPTLQLMRAFEDALNKAGHLVVVGYSFGDRHVDNVIRNWLTGDEKRTVTILDPSWPIPQQMVIGPSSELSLRDGLRFISGQSLKFAPGRVRVVRKKAAVGLAEALRERPFSQVDEVLTVALRPGDQPSLLITNSGYDLTDVRVEPWLALRQPSLQVATSFRLEPEAQHDASDLVVATLLHGETIQVFFDWVPTASDPMKVRVSGTSWASGVSQEIRLHPGLCARESVASGGEGTTPPDRQEHRPNASTG